MDEFTDIPQYARMQGEAKRAFRSKSLNDAVFSPGSPASQYILPVVISPLAHTNYLTSNGIILKPGTCDIQVCPTDDAAEVDRNSGLNSTTTPSGKCSNLRSLTGIFLGLFSGLANSIISLLVKFNDSRSIFEVSTYRYAVMIGPPTALLIYHRKNPFAWKLVKSVGWVLVLRAVLGCGATFTRYHALQKLPLADASVLMFSSPVFVAIFSRIFLKEPFRISHAVAILVTLTGCILVARPPVIFGTVAVESSVDWSGRVWGYVAAIGSAVFTASVYVTVRYMKTLDSNFVLFYMAIVGLIISAIITGALNQFAPMTNAAEIGAFFGVGFLSWLSQESMVRALRLETASLIALLRTGDIVWAFIWQVTVFKVMPHYLSIIGALLVVLCVSTLSLKESVTKLPADSKVRIFVEKMMAPMYKAKEKMLCKTKDTASAGTEPA